MVVEAIGTFRRHLLEKGVVDGDMVDPLERGSSDILSLLGQDLSKGDNVVEEKTEDALLLKDGGSVDGGSLGDALAVDGLLLKAKVIH